jgi:uncharacterized alkaline shock family protein YloU
MTAATGIPTPPKSLVAAENRGRLTIAPAVVRGIIEAASGEVDGVVGGSQRGGRAGRAARATTQLRGNTASARVRVTLDYPQSIPEALTRLRAHIVDRVAELADVTVQICDIDVTGLVSASRDGKVG